MAAGILVDSLMESPTVKGRKLLRMGLYGRGTGKMAGQRRKEPKKRRQDFRRQVLYSTSISLSLSLLKNIIYVHTLLLVASKNLL
jgi:hypothetical protein